MRPNEAFTMLSGWKHASILSAQIVLVAASTAMQDDGEVGSDIMLFYAVQGFSMYVELFSERQYRPAIIIGVIMAVVCALLDPLSRTYVAYQTLTRAGQSFNTAVMLSHIALYGSYGIGEYGLKPHNPTH